jgi:hypothetical protein
MMIVAARVIAVLFEEISSVCGCVGGGGGDNSSFRSFGDVSDFVDVALLTGEREFSLFSSNFELFDRGGY